MLPPLPLQLQPYTRNLFTKNFDNMVAKILLLALLAASMAAMLMGEEEKPSNDELAEALVAYNKIVKGYAESPEARQNCLQAHAPCTNSTAKAITDDNRKKGNKRGRFLPLLIILISYSASRTDTPTQPTLCCPQFRCNGYFCEACLTGYTC